MSDDVAGQLLDEHITIEKLTLRLRRMYLPKFRNVLPDSKVGGALLSDRKQDPDSVVVRNCFTHTAHENRLSNHSIKGGFILGGQYGEGVLLKGGNTAGYYKTVQLSYGLQAGGQKYGYVLFFMSDSAMGWLDKTGGWEFGTGPNIVVVDIGAAKAMTTTTMQSQIYAFFLDQKGLMAGLGLQGTKISRINK